MATGLLVTGLGMMVVAAEGCRRTAPPVPLEQLNAQQMRGHAVFQTRCAQCHYDRVDQPRNGPTLLGVFKKPALHSGAAATDERVTSTVMHGHGLMPAMGNVVEDEAMQDLLAYLHTL
ncbi:MAG: hypothetical protein NVSMB3_06280 [Acidobacteriaceae bacterium]